MKKSILIFILLFPTFVFADESEKELQNRILFEEAMKKIQPFTPEEIKKLKRLTDEHSKLIAPSQPYLKTRTVQIALEPGQAPIKIKTSANVVTALVFHDATGANWPISSITNGGPIFFQILRPEVPEKNLLNILPLKDYGVATVVVTLEGRDVPLVLSLYSDSTTAANRTADGLILVRVKASGPNAAVPLVQHNIKPTVSSKLIAFLDRIPPAKSKRIAVDDDNIAIWELENCFYVRTKYDLMFPAWTAIVHGASDIKCYEIQTLPRLIISENGQFRTIEIGDKNGRKIYKK